MTNGRFMVVIVLGLGLLVFGLTAFTVNERELAIKLQVAIHKSTLGNRKNGVLIANGKGQSVAFALFNLQERGQMLLGPGIDIYEGMIVGIHSRNNDLVVNALKGKQLTNVRASGKDDAIALTPPIIFSLEQALEFINDDELVEVTPLNIRIRKKKLLEHERKRDNRNKDKAETA